MRRALTFACEGATLVATLDDAPGDVGLLIVSGGNEIRAGAHRGMASLAAELAAHGHPVFRFDRRGVGDSDGANGGFTSSGPDIVAALAAFRAACPALAGVVAFGNCDAASALVLHPVAVNARVFANPWVIQPVDELPPPAAIRDRYARRLRDPAAWGALLTGRIDLKGLAKGLGRLAAPPPAQPDSLADRVVAALSASDVPTTIVLASRDATALAFSTAWGTRAARIERIETASHSFHDVDASAALTHILLRELSPTSSPRR